MSKTERRKFFQPIPLSTILDPRYQTPFSKLQQFQVDVDMDIKSCHSHPPQRSVWKKLQSTLVTAMSNLVVISHPVFASSSQTSATFVSASTRSSAATSTSLSIFSSWPCKSYSSRTNNNNNKSCSEDFLIPVTTSSSSSLKSFSSENLNSNLYHTVRSGLQCLRYLATHPLYHTQNHREKVEEPVIFMKKSQAQGQGAYPGREVMSEPTTPLRMANPSSNYEVYLQAATARLTLESFSNSKSQESAKSQKKSSSGSPSCQSPPIDIKAPGRPRSQSCGSGGGCFMIESSTVTINMGGSPGKPVGAGGGCGFGGARGGRRMKTESESSTDSFIEFSASVESTDSFCIVFEASGGVGEAGTDCVPEKDEDDVWDEDDDEEDDDEEEDEDEDEIVNYHCEIFHTEGLFQDELDNLKKGASNGIDKEVVPRKKNKKGMMVSFDENHLETRVVFEDDPASKACRETYWETFARDRSRFTDRVERTGAILNSVLTPRHRSKIYKERFSADN